MSLELNKKKLPKKKWFRANLARGTVVVGVVVFGKILSDHTRDVGQKKKILQNAIPC